MKLDASIAAIEACTTMDELRATLHRIIQNYGFSGFTFIDAGRPEVDVPYYTGTHPAAWERTYLQYDFVHIDPALARVRRTNIPFHWGNIRLPPRIGHKRAPEAKMMDAAREFGFRQGLVVPFHYRDRIGSVHSSSTVFFWEDQPKRFEKLLLRHSHELHLLMIYWVQRSIDIVRDNRELPAFFRPPSNCEPISLTLREREVMSWAARGKTIADTAEILHISAETVGGYLKSALRKLDATNKTHGVAKGLTLGIIDL